MIGAQAVAPATTSVVPPTGNPHPLSTHVVNNKARPHWECAPEEKYARQVEGRPGYYALLPLTIIADIATLPFQAIVIGMAHEGWVNIDGWPVPLPF